MFSHETAIRKRAAGAKKTMNCHDLGQAVPVEAAALNALSTNSVTPGAPCPQTTNPSLPLPQDPPSAQVTQFNGMGLSAPQGQNCSVADFLSGACLQKFGKQLAKTGSTWSSTSTAVPTQVAPPA